MYTNYDASSFKPMTSKIADDNQKIVDILTKAKNMSYNSLVNFKTADDIKTIAMENDGIARFFGEAKPSMTVTTNPAVVETYNPPVNYNPATTVTPAPVETKQEEMSAADELDSLLADLI